MDTPLLGQTSLSILHVYKDYAPVIGGMENHIRALAEAQARANHRVTVLVANRDPRTEVVMLGGVRVIRVARWATVASTPVAPGFFRWLPRIEADIVHLHFPHPPGEIAWLSRGRGGRMVVTYHSDIVRQRALRYLYRPLLARVLDQADSIIATSAAYVQSSAELKRRSDRCTVIPLGVDIERFGQPRSGELLPLRNRLLPHAGGRPVLLFVGRLRYYKGLDVLLRALQRLRDAVLLVIGDGPMGPAWTALARDLHVADRVVFAGEVSDEELPACYQLADVFVLPATSRAEAFGMVLAEAMASGLPVISTELGTGTSWVNEHGTTGLVVPPSDPASLAQGLAGLLANPERRALFGAAARERARVELSQETMFDRVEKVYRDVLASPCTPSQPPLPLTRQR